MREICAHGPVIPVLTVDDAGHAGPLARALVEGGLKVLEVTLRTAAALEAIETIAREVPAAIVGAGTLRTPGDVARAAGAGARFGVSPGLTPALLARAEALELPFLPGVATPSEAMAAAERGYRVLKFFPAESLRRGGSVVGLGEPPRRARVLPHRRHRTGQRTRLPPACQRGLHRRQLDRAAGTHQGR